MKRAILLYVTMVMIGTILLGRSFLVIAADNQRTIIEKFEAGRYDPVVTFYDIDNTKQALTIERDGSVTYETSVELRYQRKSINHNKYMTTVNSQKFYMKPADDGYYTIEEYGGNRYLTAADDGFVFDYPKRDKYGRFIIEDRHLYRPEWSKRENGWNIECKTGEKFQIDGESSYRIVQVNFSDKY